MRAGILEEEPSSLEDFSATSIVGIKKARVLPVPVFAFTRQSLPENIYGIDADCTGVRNSYLRTSLMAFKVILLIDSESNRCAEGGKTDRCLANYVRRKDQ